MNPSIKRKIPDESRISFYLYNTFLSNESERPHCLYDGGEEKGHMAKEKKRNLYPKQGHMSDHHLEPEENEIAGPVLFALVLLTLIVIVIYFWSK